MARGSAIFHRFEMAHTHAAILTRTLREIAATLEKPEVDDTILALEAMVKAMIDLLEMLDRPF